MGFVMQASTAQLSLTKKVLALKPPASEKKTKEKTRPFGVNIMLSRVIYQAVQIKEVSILSALRPPARLYGHLPTTLA